MAVLIKPTTSAVSASDETTFIITNGLSCVSADDLDGTEVVTIQYSGNGGETWQTAQNVDGDITLTAAKHQAVMRGPGSYRVAKEATVSACGVYVKQETIY